MKRTGRLLSLSALFAPLLFASTVRGQGGATCATAQAITPGTHVSDGPSAGGGAVPTCSLGFGIGETTVADVAVNADWYSYTATANGTVRVQATSALPDNDTRVSIFTGTCGSLTCLIGDDDIGATFLSYVMFPVLAGETYYIQWDDFWSANPITFNLTYTAQNAASAVTINAYPHTQSFTGANSGSTCQTVFAEPAGAGAGWTNHTGDGTEWLRRTATTPSFGSGTGPNNGFSGLAGDSYLYLETSVGTCTPVGGYYAEVSSPIFDMSTMTGTGDAQISWYDHMFGATTGRMIVQYESPANSGNWTTISTKSGNQGNQWNFNNYVTLSGASGTFRVRWIGWRDSGTNSFTGDMAIDQVVVRERPDCTAPVATATVIENCGTSEATSTFTVNVNVTDLGSLGGVPSTQATIVPSSGAPQVANATGSYVFGPYTFGTVVTFNLTHESEPACNSFITGTYRSCCGNFCSTAFPATIGVNANANSAFVGCAGGATNALASGAPVPTVAKWWTFSPATSGIYTIAACDQAPVTNADTRVSVHTGTCGALTFNVGDDDACTTPTFGSSLTMLMVSGTTYYIEWDNAWESNAHTWSLTGPAPPVAGDLCADAIALTMSPTCVNTLSTSAGATLEDPSCAAANGATTSADIWFSFVATSDLADITITPNGGYYPVLELLEGTCGSFTTLCCTFNNPGAGLPLTLLRGGLNVGQTYYLRVGHAFAGGDGGANEFNICVLDGTSPTPCGVLTGTPDYTEAEPCGTLTNSELCDAEPIVLGTIPFTFNIAGTIQAECNFRDRDFFIFTLPTTGTYQIDFTALFNSRIFFLDANGPCADPLVQISSAAALACQTGTFTQSLSAGTYALMMTTDGIFNNLTCGTVNDYLMTITAVPNLDCNLATPISCGEPASVALSGTGIWSITSCGFTTPGNEAIYAFNAPVAGTYNLTVTNSNGNFIDYFIKDASLNCEPAGWTCLDDISAAGTSVNFNIATPGNYYILADAENSAVLSTQTFRIFCPPTAVSTDFCTPIAITCGSSTAGQTTAVPGVFPANACPYDIAPSTAGVNYWSITSPADAAIDITTCGSASFDTRISVYTAAPDCNNLQCIALNDDGSGCPNFSSTVSFPATGGVTYVVAVHGFGADFGFYQLNVICGPPCAPAAGNDLCSLAATLTPALDDGFGVPTIGDNSCAYGDLPTTCDPFGAMQGVWYSFNSGPNSIMFMDLLAQPDNGSLSAGGMNYALYDGGCSGLGALGEQDCAVDANALNIALPALTPSTDYLLYLWNDGELEAGTFSVLLRRPAMDDAAVDTILEPEGPLCSTTIVPRIVIRNNGENNLVSATITYDVDGGPASTFNWTGNLAYQETDTVFLPSIQSPSAGLHTLNVSSSLPNGNADGLTANDGASKGLNITGESVVVVINTDNNGDEISWTITDAFAFPVASGGPYTGQDNELIQTTVCLPTSLGNCYGFSLSDAGGDGLCCLAGAGFWELRTVNNRTLLRDLFSSTPNGSVSPNPNVLYGYGSEHAFCLPAGPSPILGSECGIFNNTLQNKVYTTAVAGVLNYQFEFSDPDAGFVRRIGLPRNWVKFSEMVTNPLTPGTVYFARARADQGAPGYFDDHFGTGCEMAIDGNQVPGCTQLIDNDALPTHSCGVTKPFGGSAKIWAVPVVGATQYRFSFSNVGEGFVRNITRPSYVCLLNWVSFPLQNGVTYSVTVEVFVNGVWGGFCGNACDLTILNPPANLGRAAEVDALPMNDGVELYPNPTRDGRATLRLNGLSEGDHAISVEVYDAFGKRVVNEQFRTGGDVFSTILQLDGTRASGIYMVNITVDGTMTTKRLSVL